jgi:hypothetical protein
MAVSQMKAITLYVVLVFALSSVFYALIIVSGHVEGGAGRYIPRGGQIAGGTSRWHHCPGTRTVLAALWSMHRIQATREAEGAPRKHYRRQQQKKSAIHWNSFSDGVSVR